MVVGLYTTLDVIYISTMIFKLRNDFAVDGDIIFANYQALSLLEALLLAPDMVSDLVNCESCVRIRVQDVPQQVLNLQR